MATPRHIQDFLETDDARISVDDDDVQILTDEEVLTKKPKTKKRRATDKLDAPTKPKKAKTSSYTRISVDDDDVHVLSDEEALTKPKTKKRHATNQLDAPTKPKKAKTSSISMQQRQLMITDCDGFDTTEENVILSILKPLLSLPQASRIVYEHAYMIQKIPPHRLFPNDQHAKFFELVTNPEVKTILLTGLPGAGKSTILNIIKAYLIDKLTVGITPAVLSSLRELFDINASAKFTNQQAALKMVVTTSPTGSAASLIGGITFDSLFAGCDLQKGLFDNKSDIPIEVQKKVSAIRVIIIDELSMIHPSKFANADKIFRLVKGTPTKFFGNCKVILSGDFFQLKPVYDKNDSITRIIAAAKQDDKKMTHPLVFDTNSWLSEERNIRMVELTKSFRQEESQIQFMDLLGAVRTGDLLQHHVELLQSRISTYEEFCIQIESENPGVVVMPIFNGRPAVNNFNDQQLNKLSGTEYCYVASFLCSYSRDLNRVFQMQEPSALERLLDPENTVKKYVHFGQLMSKHFEGKANPLNLYSYDGMIDNHEAPIEHYSGYYFDRGILPVSSVLRLAQSGKYLNKANVITRLKVGAKISITKNLDVKHKLTNGSEGKVVGFCSIAKFMTFKGTKRLPSGTYVSKSVNVELGALKEDTEPIEDEDDEYDFRILFGGVDASGKTTNAKVEKFALVRMDPNCDVKYLLLTPVLTQCQVVSDSRAKKDSAQLDMYMKRCHANNVALNGNAKNMSHLSHPERMSLLAQAQRQINIDNDSMKGSHIFAFHIPACLAWATTIHSVQGATIQAAWLGEVSNWMEHGMFYVFLSRVSNLAKVAWAQDPCKFIKSNPKVIEFYNRMRTHDALRAVGI